MTLAELRQKYAALCDKQQTIVDKAVSEERGLTEEEKTEFEGLQNKIDDLDGTIKTAEAVHARNAALDQPANPIIRPGSIVVGDDLAGKKPWNSMGEFFHAVYSAGQPGSTADKRLVYAAASGASVGVPSDGGWLVGKQFEEELLKTTHETGILSPLCRTIPIGEGFDGLQINAVDESSRATGSRWGGIRVYRKAEAESATASKPKFRKMELSLEDMVGLVYATDRLLRDATAFEAVVKEGFGEEFGFKLDDEIFRGTGAGECLGVLNSPALVTQAKETGQAADTIVNENISKMWSRLWPRSRKNAIWAINSEIEPELDKLAITAGTGALEPRFITYDLEGAMRIKGRPVVAIEQASALGDVGDISLLDLKQYLLIDKGVMESASSIHVRFIYGENTFRFTYSVNGQPMWNNPLTPYKGSATQSPMVVLAAR